MTETRPEPLIRFLIGGVQKGGTTALASYLGSHPRLRLPRDKEAHVFDDPNFQDASTREQIDRHYQTSFPEPGLDTLHGDATPFYVFHPRVVARIARYNPAMRWIVLLRDPVERALSHYHMERIRGHERWPFWIALLRERSRLRGQEANFARNSPMRRHSYRARGDYAAQLAVLQSHFPRDQILLLRTESLERDPSGTVAQACRFLGVEAPTEPGDYARVFAGEYTRWPPGDWRDRLLRRWWRRELDAQASLGLTWGRA